MRKTLALFALVLTMGMTAALDAEARRLGGGRSTGMQRQSVTAPPANHPGAGVTSGSPGQAAPVAGSAAAAAAPAAAATAKRSWMGPVAGIAAGLGIAALASHFGFGEALANIMTMALLAMAVLFVIGLVLRKRAAGAGGALAGAGGVGRMGGVQDDWRGRTAAHHEAQGAPAAGGGSTIGSRIGGREIAGSAGAVGHIPSGFDTAAFERTARDQFAALQAANDAKDLARLRDYLSPEMFELVQAEIAERGDVAQTTEVFGLNAQVLDVAEEADRYVVSVRFTGSVRERADAVPLDLDEVWHLAKPRAGLGGWVIAGIQQGR